MSLRTLTSQQTMELPPGAPVSPYFVIETSPKAGRGVYASRAIPAGTDIWKTSDLCVHMIHREHRKEVCAQCFGYDRGRNLSVRDLVHGFAFCSKDCQIEWNKQDEVSLEAWAAVERLIKTQPKEDEAMAESVPIPSPTEIKTGWRGVEKQAEIIRAARGGENTKVHRKAIREATARSVAADVLPLQLSTLLVRKNFPEVWQTIKALAADEQPYKTHRELTNHLNSYLHLLTILPEELLKWVRPEHFFTLLTRDCHNSFGIRSLDDDGAEYFGFGVWPSASYFNHSCNPSVLKQRDGRSWTFTTARDIEQGEQLCITYLSGQEIKMSRGQRVALLKQNWGFDCACERCEDM